MVQMSHKLAAVLNEKIDTGKAMNALAHLSLGLGASLGKDAVELIDYQDADGNAHPYISKMPFIILKANSNQIRQLRQMAIQHGVSFCDFNDTMTIGSWEEQQKRSLETREGDLVYFGMVLFGPWETVTKLTRKFSLWK